MNTVFREILVFEGNRSTHYLTKKMNSSLNLHYIKQIKKYITCNKEQRFFRKWPFSGGDDRGKTSPRALVFTRCDIQTERL
jgi:hypothetical protein